MAKQILYRIYYQYDGFGSCLVKAKTPQEARGKYYEGDFFGDTDDGQQYEVIKVEKSVKN
jgi:hypothetical protein